MIGLFHEPVSAGKDRVTVIHYKPERLSAEQKKAIILIENEALPKAENRPGKSAVLYVNPQTKESWYEYEDRPPTQEELLTEISQKLTTLIDVTKRE
ncbi:hypothetical protein ES703_111780 [subsurface metagenome]